MIKNYFKTALRNFRRHKLFTFINIIGLSIGISASLVICLIVNYDSSFDKFHKDGDRIYRVVSDYVFNGTPIHNSGVTGMLPGAVKNEVTGLEQAAALYTQGYTAVIPTAKDKKFKNQNVVFADNHYFNIFAHQWLAGQPNTALTAPGQLVLSDKDAKKYFPSLSYNDMIGKQVVYADSIRTTVVGVVESFKENSDVDFDDFISYSTVQHLSDIKHTLSEWGGTTSSSQYFIKLLPNTKLATIEKQLNGLMLKYNPIAPEDKGNKESFGVQPLSDLHFNGTYGAINHGTASKSMLLGLVIIAAFLLILACINFINLTTAQASQRAKEIGIRKTLGSSRAQLIGQYLSETFLVTLLAVVVSIALIPIVLKIFSDFISPNIKFNMVLQPVFISFLVVITLVVSFISGFYPALVLSNFKPVSVLKTQTASIGGKVRNAWLRKSLTVTQFVIAQFFIMATLLVSKQVYYALHKDLGFKKDAIVSIGMPWNQRDQGLKQVLFNKIKALPQVQLISFGGDVPSSTGWNTNDVTYTDGKKEIKSELNIKWGDENYINVFKIKLLAGRNISMGDTTNAMIINNTYAHIIGFTRPQDAIGKYVSFSKTEKREIVGVFADFYQSSLHQEIKPLAIYPQLSNFYSLHMALNPETPGGNEWHTAFAGMEKAWKEVYPDEDFSYQFFDERLAQMYSSEQNVSKLLAWATGLSIVISCLGLLGLTIYTTNLRKKEIGVRKVLGASVAQVITLLSKELVILVAIAFVIVTPIAWIAMYKWMEDFADKTPISWWLFAVSGAGIMLLALLTLSFRTARAALANPVVALKNE